MSDPHEVTKQFEAALCEYTGAKYAVTTTSCTMAIFLACEWYQYSESITIPRFTYPSVPMSIIHAGHSVEFEDIEWRGEYQLKPFPIWDSARRFYRGMYREGQVQCLSFHATKILGDTQGGCILHDSGTLDIWLRKMRFDGRTENIPTSVDEFWLGYHAYMSPDIAARLLMKLYALPDHNDDLPNDDYPDLSLQECFK